MPKNFPSPNYALWSWKCYLLKKLLDVIIIIQNFAADMKSAKKDENDKFVNEQKEVP